jgi:hypothetical protein
MTDTRKVPVSERALYQRINRKLAPRGRLLKATRRPGTELGKYYIIDTERNLLLLKRVDLDYWGRRLGVLAAWEEVR